MGLRRKRSGGGTTALTGADYLLALAHNASQQDQPYAEMFHRMLSSALDEGHPLYRDAIARRPLREHEATPALVVTGAVQAALANGDLESAREALTVGVALLVKWPMYLDGGVDQHPEMTMRP